MSKTDTSDLSWDEWDEHHFPRSAESEFDKVVERAISRRGFLSGVLAFGSGAAAMSAGLLAPGKALAEAGKRFAFSPIPIQTDGTVHVPEGYNWKVLTGWGDPLFSDADGYDVTQGGGPVENSDKIFGENTDGMETFSFQGRQLVAVNHEYVNPKLNLPTSNEGVALSADDVTKLQNLQGVSVMEIVEGDNGWTVVKDSPFNRRIHHRTPMTIVGPAAGHDLLKTAADPTGTSSLGTMNNCGSGKTPWGTYLTCEENFNGYFGRTEDTALEDKVAAGYKRYGVGSEGRYQYEKFDPRYDTSKNPNEPHRFGWVVEIDPTDPNSTPVKHTGLGRFKHGNAEVVVAPDGRVVVYLGDDERGEYLYKFVSNGVYTPGGSTEGLLDDGTLFAAKFNDDQTGEWLALTPESTGMDAAEILIFTRMAASAVGATNMDRPEWIATNPIAAEGYCCLTNNSRRGALNDDGSVRANAGGDVMVTNPANPRDTNRYGQIVRWRPSNDDHAAGTFGWDLYVMAGNPDIHSDAYAGSSNINSGNLFNSPDGMAIDTTGIVWIQTDGNDKNEGDFAGMGNNQMLAGDPVTGEIVRFMTGPKGCEVTGLCWSADRRSMFVGIQHPGSGWPDNGSPERSSVIVIKRDDNGLVG
ncbi:MAG: PhoX family phosphatase [Pseudomonadota bacterium]